MSGIDYLSAAQEFGGQPDYLSAAQEFGGEPVQETAPEKPDQPVQLEDGSYRMPSGRVVTPEGGFMSFLRSAGTHILPALGTAAGSIGSGLLAAETGPGAIPIAIAGGAAAGTGVQAAQTAIARRLMGEEAYQQELEQEEANRLAHPGWASAGGFLGEAPSMVGAGGITKATGKFIVPALENRFGQLGARIIQSGTAGATMETASAGERAVTGEGHWADVPEAPLHGVVTMGPLGFIPHAQGILKSVLKAVPDSATLALSNGMYDYAVHGKPIDLTSITQQAGGDIPGFALLNGVTAFFHGPHIASDPILQESQKIRPDINPAASEALGQTELEYANFLETGKKPGIVPHEQNEATEQGTPASETLPEGEAAPAVETPTEPPVGESGGAQEEPLTPSENATPEGSELNQGEPARIEAGTAIPQDSEALRESPSDVPSHSDQLEVPQDIVDSVEREVSNLPEPAQKKWTPEIKEAASRYVAGDEKALDAVPDGPMRKAAIRMRREINPPELGNVSDVNRELKENLGTLGKNIPTLPPKELSEQEQVNQELTRERALRANRPEVPEMTPEQRRTADEKAVTDFNQLWKAPAGKGIRLATPKLGEHRSNFIRAFEKIFGRRVVFVENEEGGRLPFQGNVHPTDPHVLLIDAKSPIEPLSITGHEFIDSLLKTHPELHADLMAAIRPHLQGVDEYLKDLNERRATAGLPPVDRAYAETEMAADFAGDILRKPQFLEKLAEENPTLFRKLADILRDWLAKVKSAFRKTLGGEALVKDIETAEREIARILKKVPETPETLAKGEARYSLPKDEEHPFESIYREQMRGSSTTMADVLDTWERFKAAHPEATPDQFRNEMSRLAREGKIMVEPPENPRDLTPEQQALLIPARGPAGRFWKPWEGEEMGKMEGLQVPKGEGEEPTHEERRETPKEMNDIFTRSLGGFFDEGRFSLPKDEEEGRPTAVQNKSFEERGLDYTGRGTVNAPAEIEDAKSNYNAASADAFVDNLLQHPPDRDGTPQEMAMLAVHQQALDNQQNRAGKILNDPKATPEEKSSALAVQADAEEKQGKLNDAAKMLANIWHRMGAMRQVWLNADFSLAGMMRRIRRIMPDGKLTDQQKETAQKDAQRLEELEKKKADIEKESAKQTVDEIRTEENGFQDSDWWEEAKKHMPPDQLQAAEKLELNLRRQAAIRERLAQLEAKLPEEGRYSLPKQEIEKGLEGLSADDLRSELKRLAKESEGLFKSLQSKATGTTKQAVQRAQKTTKKAKGAPITEADITPRLEKAKGNPFVDMPGTLLDKIARMHIQQGAKTEADLTERMRQTLDPVFPGITANDIHKALSRYGQATYPSQEATAKTLRELKGEMLKLEQMRAVAETHAKFKPTGPQRDKPTAKVRELMKDLNRLMRKEGLETDPKSAITNRLKNEIEELDRIIAGKASPRKPNEPPQYTPEMEALKKHRDELAAYVKDLTGPSAEHEWNTKAEQAGKSLEKEYRRRIAEKEFEAKKAPSFEANEAVKKARYEAEQAKNEFDELKARERPDIAIKAQIDRLTKAKQRSIDEYHRRIDEQDFTPRQKSAQPTDAALDKLNIEQERIRQEFQNKLRKWQRDQRSDYQKILDGAVATKRGFVLSSPVSFAKLAAASLSRGLTTAFEDIMGGAWSRAIPKLAEKAKLEGGGWNQAAYTRGLSKAFTQGIEDAKTTVRKGKSDLDVKYGGAKADHDVDWSSWIGRMHAAIKAPIKRFMFEHAYQKLADAAERDAPGSTSDPVVQARIGTQAYQAAQRGIFLQDNLAAQMLNSMIGRAAGSKSPLGKPTAAFLRIMLPIVKVPTNIISEAAQMAYGVPVGLTKLAQAYRAGIENLSPENADIIMRNLKKGSLGASLMTLGFMAAGSVGGYYSPDDKRKAGDVKPGRFRVFGVDIPTWLTHAPAFEALQMGATLRRSLGNGQGLTDAALASAMGLAEETPFLNEMMRLKDLQSAKGRGQFFGELLKSNVEPALLQKVAEWTDRARPLQASDLLTGEGTNKRAPETFGQVLKTGIPGLREEVPIKIEKPLSGTGIMLPHGLDFTSPIKSALKKNNPSLTDDRFKKYVDIRTQEIRDRLAPVRGQLGRMSAEDAKATVAQISHEASQEAKNRLGLH